VKRHGLAGLAGCLAGCLGPLVEDELGVRSRDLLPPGASVPLADEDPELVAQLREHQYVAGVVPRLAAFGGGTALELWDFGPAPDHAAPMFVLVDGSGAPIDHPPIVDLAPGDPGYSPFWSVLHVPIGDAYAGERVTSATALEDARRLGLVGSPVFARPGVFRPLVTADVRLADREGAYASGRRSYYRGRAVTHFELGSVPLAEDHVAVIVGRRCILRREGGEPLNEAIRGIDLVGDGDLLDSNDVLEQVGGTPVFQTWHVVVPTWTRSIDTTHDQKKADHRHVAQLFDPDPVEGVVLDHAIDDELRAYALVTALVRE
jgi:hypothetical protein